VVAEVDQDLVDAVKRNRDSVTINIARRDRVEQADLSAIEICNPGAPMDREKLAESIHLADEMATAVPSVSLYDAGGSSSIAALLAENVNTEKEQILYAAENNNYAAEILRDAMLKYTDRKRIERFHIANTVIGKMSGVIRGTEALEEIGLRPMTPDLDRGVLVEEFNRILVSRLPCRERGIAVFEEKDDLLPFEEAKLYGHNAIHCLLGYLAYGRGYRVMSEIGADAELMALGRRAFVEESGAALVRKHGATGEDLFTPEGFREYARDLLERMVNPFLHDLVARICRDPIRKLGYSDRLFGAMREALKQGIRPDILSLGAAAGLKFIVSEGIEVGLPSGKAKPGDAGGPDQGSVRTMLDAIWKDAVFDEHREECVSLVQRGWKRLRRTGGSGAEA
jgi:hypothetical protein